MTDQTLTLQFDGGSRGNPGPAGIGVVISADDGTPVVTLGRFIGRATNNVAEYRAVITALEKALELGARRVVIRGDSELIIKQLRGEYRVKHPDMRTLHAEAADLIGQFDSVTIEHNLRHKNELADRLANLAMDRKADVTDVDTPATGATTARGTEAAGPEGPSPLDAPSPEATAAGDRFGCPRCGCAIEVQKPSPIRPHQLRPFACQCGMKMEPAPALPSRRR